MEPAADRFPAFCATGQGRWRDGFNRDGDAILTSARQHALRGPKLRFQVSSLRFLSAFRSQVSARRLPGCRANEFRERCRGLGLQGVSLHSYRYAWAERAKTAGYPERFAQLALGHNSKAVHRAYARKAQGTLPPLEDYEKTAATAPVIRLPIATTA